VPKGLDAVLDQCWELDDEKRPSMQDILLSLRGLWKNAVIQDEEAVDPGDNINAVQSPPQKQLQPILQPVHIDYDLGK